MKPIIQKLTNLQDKLSATISQLNLKKDKLELQKLEEQMNQSDFWSDSSQAEIVSRAAAELKSYISDWDNLESEISTNLELAQLSSSSEATQFEFVLEELTNRFDKLSKAVKFSAEYDKSPAIIQITAGVGGTDAQDWAEMLQTMYIKFANTNSMQVEVLDTSYGDEAGIKSTTLRISGLFAYGQLKAEKGVHRLVRLSPFNSDNLRQTSFALVDVIPEINDNSSSINPKDLRIDVYRAGGRGGQSVNTTDSAVRITHLPTGLTVSIQSERSQLKNKQRAMSILNARLAQLMREQKLANISQLRGNIKSADWGAQIRSYVLHPYKKVKDHRTKYESNDINAVLNGEINDFIEAYLDWKLSNDNQ